MDSSFRSTVLQRPLDDEDDRERRHRRDILNPSSSVVGPPGAGPSPGPRLPGFSLRSPTQTEYHATAYSSPAPPAPGTHQSPRAGLSSFMATAPAGAPSMSLPPLGAVPNTASHRQGAPPSPVRAPAGYYASQPDLHQPREKPAGSFYDPTTDITTTKERRVSETGSWHGANAVSTPKVRELRNLA